MLQKFLSNATCLELRRVGATKKKKKILLEDRLNVEALLNRTNQHNLILFLYPNSYFSLLMNMLFNMKFELGFPLYVNLTFIGSLFVFRYKKRTLDVDV